MLKSTLLGLVLGNVENLWLYQRSGDEDLAIVNDVSDFIIKTLKNLPWYYRLPIRILIFITGMLSLIVMKNNLNSLPSQKRLTLFRYARFIPFFATLQELIRSLAFLRLFDAIPYMPDN